MIENISTIYEPGSIDLIHIRNALDHCANPMLGIIESLACLRNGNNEAPAEASYTYTTTATRQREKPTAASTNTILIRVTGNSFCGTATHALT